jgi:hypothetical protein
MKKLIIVLLIVFGGKGIAQNSTTYKIESLTPPTKFLYQRPACDAFKFSKANIEKSSQLPDSLVTFGEHPFLTGILTAYKEHRPFVLSPDIVWLLISQGFARHISNNAEEFRKEIVNFEKKKNLTVVSNEITLGNPNSNWESVFPQFTNQISDYTGKELTNILVSDFTTTTPTTRIVSEITVMETVKAYFDYKVMIIGCGIPKITIEGTVSDWEKVLEKTKYISRYKLEWWTDELQPILKQIIETKKGKFTKSFWMDMVKAHTEKKYGSPTTIDGWIIKFFPYTKEGKRSGLKPITKIDNLAAELVKVPFILEDVPNNKSYKMEFWGGFVGLSQNKADFTLKPEIGWCINNVNSLESQKSKFTRQKEIDDLSISNIDSVPEEIYSLQRISILHLNFRRQIHITEKLASVRIDNLEINGIETKEEEEQIKKLFPETKLKINGIEK